MLTKKQKQILDFIIGYINKNNLSPTRKEIAKNLGLSSVSNIQQHLDALALKNYIRINPGKSRNIELIEKVSNFVKIPLKGTIAAGQPIEGIEEKENIAIPKEKILKAGNIFALRVKGDSMIDENINDGDIILIKEQNTAENGQKVVALIDNSEVTLKTFYKERKYIRLQPANKNMNPIIIENNRDFAIQGVLFDVIKNYEQYPLLLKIPQKKEKSEQKSISAFLNKIYHGDIMNLLKQLPDNSTDMVFGDPDYNVGIKYGDKTYTKNFNEYINWYIELTKESMRVLRRDGNLFMLNYPKQNAHLRVKYLDNFYPEISEYAWVYNTNVGHTPKRFTTAHRSILHVRKTANNKFYKDAVALPYKNPGDRRILQNLANGSKGRMPYSWFEFNLVKNVSKEKTYHACQIPQKLTELLIKASTKENDIVLVLFGGSGAELEVCKKMNRNFISAEIDEKYCKLINDRLKNGYIPEDYKLKFNNKKRVAI